MISDPDITLTAILMIGREGKDVASVAARCEAELGAKGDTEGVSSVGCSISLIAQFEV